MEIRPIRMINHATTEVFDDLRIPANSLIGEEGKGFRYILTGMNAERILIAADVLVMQNGLSVKPPPMPVTVKFPPVAEPRHPFPLPKPMPICWRRKRSSIRRRQPMTMAKILVLKPISPKCWPLIRHGKRRACLPTHGGFGFTEEYDVERKFRETGYQIAPISTNDFVLYRRACHENAAFVLKKSF